VKVFKCLGRLSAYDDNDTWAVRGDIKKGVRCLGKTLPHAPSRACSVIYKAAVQLILLFGSKTWTCDLEEFGRVSYKGCLAYDRQEANEASRRYVDIPKLSGCS
jgi:hypothetical protein